MINDASPKVPTVHFTLLKTLCWACTSKRQPDGTDVHLPGAYVRQDLGQDVGHL